MIRILESDISDDIVWVDKNHHGDEYNTRAVFIEDTELHFISQIFKKGKNRKSYETRPKKSLNQFCNGKWTGIIPKGSKTLVGYVKFGKCQHLTKDEFQSKSWVSKHKVTNGSQYDSDDNGKFVYPIIDVMKLDKPIKMPPQCKCGFGVWQYLYYIK